MRRTTCRRISGLVALVWCSWLVVPLGARSAGAHEPNHGFGPATLWEGGWAIGIEAELEEEIFRSTRSRERRIETELEIFYGLTSDITLGLELPLVYAEAREAGVSDYTTGLGDITLGAKWRFFRKQGRAQSLNAAVRLGVEAPTGDEGRKPPLGSDSVDVQLGLAASYDSIWVYVFAHTTVVRSFELDEQRPGDALFADLAVGFRLWEPVYGGIDLVLLVEGNLEWQDKLIDEMGDRASGTQRATLFVSPGFLLFIDTLELKGSVQLPVWEDLGHARARTRVRVSLGIEYLF